MELTFTIERETKNTVRYAEDGKDPAVGTLYVSKTALATIGTPDHLVVTVAPKEA